MFDFIVTDITIEDLIIDTRVAATVLTGVFAIVLLIRSRKEQSLIKRKGLFWAGILFQLLVVNLILIGYYELDTYSLFFEYGSLGLITLIPLLFSSLWICKFFPLLIAEKTANYLRILLVVWFFILLVVSLFDNPFFYIIRIVSPLIVNFTILTMLVLSV